ncbi:RidA family protein [Azorhizobium caulinodans]|uniref:RidA family protein n=1 Tax=Azorhizobium caulinodans TaxID=7 RepID=UPI002FBEBB26
MSAPEIIEVPVVSEAIRRLGAPTSALVRAGGLLFTCGMPPLDLATGAIVSGPIEVQAECSLDALAFALAHAGSSLNRVVKATVFVTDPALMGPVNRIYAARFASGFPARTSAAIKPWSQPFDIEIECVAMA